MLSKEFETCRSSLRRRVLKFSDNAIFKQFLYEKIDACALDIGCRLPKWKNQLYEKKENLEGEVKILNGGWRQLLQNFGKYQNCFKKMVVRFPIL